VNIDAGVLQVVYGNREFAVNFSLQISFPQKKHRPESLMEMHRKRRAVSEN
jgi:hypothetical protein